MTRDEALADLRATFGAVSEIPLPEDPGMVLAVVETPQAVPGGALMSRVAFKLPESITARPLHFVEVHVRLPNGGRPNNASTQALAGRLWQTWSLNTGWSPSRHTLSQLAFTVLKIWDR